MKLIIDVDEKLVCEGFERPFTEEERNILIRAIGNAKSYNPSGDAISREALKKALNFVYNCDYIGSTSKEGIASDIIEYIDNAPTVEAYTSEDIVKYISATEDLVREKLRPQGEWITKNIEKPYGRCNQCGEICEIDNFCGNCGADMRGDKENE